MLVVLCLFRCLYTSGKVVSHFVMSHHISSVYRADWLAPWRAPPAVTLSVSIRDRTVRKRSSPGSRIDAEFSQPSRVGRRLGDRVTLQLKEGGSDRHQICLCVLEQVSESQLYTVTEAVVYWWTDPLHSLKSVHQWSSMTQGNVLFFVRFFQFGQ